jgi:hypothetical protein
MNWISVAERLPEPQERVLIWVHPHRHKSWMAHMVIAYRIASGEWIMRERAYDVTHWMPLPDPPAKGEG